MTDRKDQPLSATAFEPAPTASQTIAAEETSGGQPRWVVIGLALSIVLLIFVFIVLPQLVAPSDTALPTAATDPTDASGPVPASSPANIGEAAGNGRSPFAEAQEGALRREAQEVLQALLALQESLAIRQTAPVRPAIPRAQSRWSQSRVALRFAQAGSLLMRAVHPTHFDNPRSPH